MCTACSTDVHLLERMPMIKANVNSKRFLQGGTAGCCANSYAAEYRAACFAAWPGVQSLKDCTVILLEADVWCYCHEGKIEVLRTSDKTPALSIEAGL